MVFPAKERVLILIPSTRTRSFAGNTIRTLPLWPLSFPASTRTSSPFLTCNFFRVLYFLGITIIFIILPELVKQYAYSFIAQVLLLQRQKYVVLPARFLC